MNLQNVGRISLFEVLTVQVFLSVTLISAVQCCTTVFNLQANNIDPSDFPLNQKLLPEKKQCSFQRIMQKLEGKKIYINPVQDIQMKVLSLCFSASRMLTFYVNLTPPA